MRFRGPGRGYFTGSTAFFTVNFRLDLESGFVQSSRAVTLDSSTAFFLVNFRPRPIHRPILHGLLVCACLSTAFYTFNFSFGPTQAHLNEVLVSTRFSEDRLPAWVSAPRHHRIPQSPRLASWLNSNPPCLPRHYSPTAPYCPSTPRLRWKRTHTSLRYS